MWYIITIVWLLLCLPLARDVDKQLQSVPNKYNVLMNLFIFVRTLIVMPFFYLMVIKNLLTRNK
jgi:hypothetical protein